MANGPLHGVRVLEFSQIVALPVCGINLSDLGADVIKVEPPGGESIRQSGAIVPNESKAFQGYNRGKRSLVLDIRTPEGMATVDRLIPQMDIVGVNFRPGVADRVGIGYDRLRTLNPGLIYIDNTGFGPEGPEAARAGSDVVAQAYSGLMAADGKVDDVGAPEMISASPIADYVSGVAAAMGVCAALYHRERTGVGQRIGTSLLRSSLFIQAQSVMEEPITDEIAVKPMLAAIEQARADGVPYGEMVALREQGRKLRASLRLYYGGYKAADGAVVLGALTPANRNGARRVLGIEDEPSDSPDFDSTDPVNQAGVDRWRATIQERMQTKTVAEWVALFDGEGVPVSPVHLPEEMSRDPQVVADGIMVDIEHSVTGKQRLVGPLIQMSETPAAVRMPAPALAEHTDQVLSECGFSAEELAALHAGGIIE